jgi:uncharacterized protein YcbK (DUF882 family)
MLVEWDYFTHNELECKCGCEDASMKPEFMKTLVEIRKEFDRPMVITSAFRCKEHNDSIGGAKDSPHRHGQAVDVSVNLKDAYDLICLSIRKGMTGIGVKQNGLMAGRFIHLDNMKEAKGRPRPTVWSY